MINKENIFEESLISQEELKEIKSYVKENIDFFNELLKPENIKKLEQDMKDKGMK